MKIRRFKALEGTGKYQHIEEKIAIYDDNGKQIDCCVIHEDDEGREYYHPSNPHNKLGLFSDRPKDAMECIRNGFGDVIQSSNILGLCPLHSVIRFIDREYGEKLRQKTIEGWKDAKFSYAIKLFHIYSISDGRLVKNNNELMYFGDTFADILTFDTEEQASNFIKELENTVKGYVDQYINLERTGDNDLDYERIITPFVNKVEEELGGINSVAFDVFMNSKGVDNEEQRYSLKVVQIVLPME